MKWNVPAGASEGAPRLVQDNVLQPFSAGPDASTPLISQDGRFLVYAYPTNSSATTTMLLRYDAATGQTGVITNSANSGFSPSMSADGRYVAYRDNVLHLWVWDGQVSANIYSNVSVAVRSYAISPAGTRVAWQTTSGLNVTDFATASDIFNYSWPLNPGPPIQSRTPVWSGDGRFFAYITPSLLGGNSTDTNSVRLMDFQTSNTITASINFNHTLNAEGLADVPTVSADGRFVLYRHTATNIVPMPFVNGPNLFIFDRVTGSNALVTDRAIDKSGLWWVSKPATSGNGAVIAYQSHRDETAADLNQLQDVMTRSFVPWGMMDTDGDGTADTWMQYYFGHNTGQAGDNSRAGDDADSDGMTNLQEYLAGTNPTNAGSLLRLQVSPMVTGNGLLLTWAAVPGMSYKVQYKNHAGDAGWTDAGGSVTISGPMASFGVSTSQSSRYYRVVANN